MACIFAFTVSAHANTTEPYAVEDNCTVQPDQQVLMVALEVWLAEREALDLVRAALFNRGESRVDEIQNSVRHIFEQEVLPMYVYDYEEEMIYALNTANLEEIEMYVNLFWNRLALHRIIHDLDEAGFIKVDGGFHAHVDRLITGEVNGERVADTSGLVPFAPFCEDCGTYKIAPILQAYGLYFPQHVLGISIEESDAGDIILIEMYATGWTILSTYIGMVYVEAFNGLQVFTVEKSFGENIYMFSAVFVEGRQNLGEIANCPETFINRISRAVLSLN